MGRKAREAKMLRSEVESLINQLKGFILTEIEKRNYDNALGMISTCANILYQTNLYYMDSMLENSIAEIAEKLLPDRGKTGNWGNACKDRVLFYDGFGLNDRGLAQIYLKALCKVKKVAYVTFLDRKDKIPGILEILDSFHCECHYIKRRTFSLQVQIKQLDEIVGRFRPGHMFFYSTPDDVTATSVMSVYGGLVKRYQINLTDHAFWLGSQCIDRCIEFRNYGASISREYRNIPEEKITVIPYYPIIHYDREFQGYPFALKPGQKVIFSGGALYKTYGDGNRYYQMVDHILETYEDAVFWYAGTGDDTEMRKLISKYPDRAYLTPERSDLHQLLGKCRFYLNTYPLGGGLMRQYAVMAGVVPLALRVKHDNSADDILIGQSKLGIEFTDINELYKEINRLMTDDQYIKEKKELIKQSVISPGIFDEEIRKLVSGGDSDRFKAEYNLFDTTIFRQIYIERLKSGDLNKMLVQKNSIKAAIRYFPIRFLKGGIMLVFKKYLKNVSCC